MKFDCPQCSQKFEGDVSFGGSEIDCPTCHFRFIIPLLDDDDIVAITPPGMSAKVAEISAEEKYTFHGQIARGGMGKIVSATDTSLGRSVAVKQLVDPEEDPALVRQLIREAQITARLSHPGIVPIHELGHDADGRIYYTMKHIRGEPLDQVLEKLRAGDPVMIEKSPFHRLLIIFSRICDAIGYANDMGIVHRDIKPDNIMLAPYGEYLLIDWGIAKDLNNKDNEENLVVSAFRYIPEKGDYGATLHGAVFGSPSYMSPEQARGDIDRIDARSDVFGLGALLFEILTLSPPYEGETPEDAVKSAANRDIKRISEIRNESPNPLNPWPHLKGAELPESVLAVAMKAMRMNPDDRYQTAAELRRDIDAYLAGYTTEAENAGFFKIIRVAINRHKKIATALAAGVVLACLAIGTTADMNRRETVKARQARTEAVNYITQANDARDQRQRVRLEVAPSYVEMARLLANRGDEEDALSVARLAAEYDPNLAEATALVKALEIYFIVKKGKGSSRPVPVGACPSLTYLLNNPELLIPEPGIEMSEQTLTRLSRAYSEVGLSRFAGQLTAEQTQRVARHRSEIAESWSDDQIEWELTLAPELSSLCVDDEVPSYFPGYSKWAAELDRTYPGQILHLVIHRAENLPDLSILSKLAIESVSFGADVHVTREKIEPLSKCHSLKVISLESGKLNDLSFLENLPLVALKIDNESSDLDLSPLAGCNTLRVLSGGRKNRFKSLSSLPPGGLQIFTGNVQGGDYSQLEKMPLRVLGIRGLHDSIDFKSLKSLPIESLIAEGINLEKNWDTISTWPIEFLSVDSRVHVDAAKLETPLRMLSHLYLQDGQWTGEVTKLFPALKHLVDETGRSFGLFINIESLESIQIDGDGRCVCYLSALEKVVSGKDLHISPNMPVQVLPEAIALNIVNNQWDAASTELEKLVNHIEKHPRLTIASVNAKQLDTVISNRSDPDQIFVSTRRSHHGSFYQAVFCGLTREKAELFAKKVGGSLATIESREEELFLAELIRSRPEYGAFWVAGYAPSLKRVGNMPDGEAPVLPSNDDIRFSRPKPCMYPIVIEWK